MTLTIGGTGYKERLDASCDGSLWVLRLVALAMKFLGHFSETIYAVEKILPR